MRVKKLNGEFEEYNSSKLKNSLRNAGANDETIKKIMAKIGGILYDGIETRKLYRFILNELKKYQPDKALRYTLKEAILRLGKEGFHFEKYVAKIFEEKGYSVLLNRIVMGEHIEHEIDISAEKGKEKLMIECKHSINPWKGFDIQTALYIYARFLDVKSRFTCPVLVTNTKFSDQAIKYSKGVGLKLMGWKFPAGDSLEQNIEKFKLYPITILSGLDRTNINRLFYMGIFLVRELLSKNAGELAGLLRIKRQRASKILKEAGALLK